MQILKKVMSNTKREQAVEAIGKEKVKALENALANWLNIWISTEDKAMENSFQYDDFTNYLGFKSKQIDLQNALMELQSKGINLDIAPIESTWMECEPRNLDP